MPNSTVFFSRLFDGVLMETKVQYAKELSSIILRLTGYKNGVNLADSVSGNFKIVVAMYDFGNLSGLRISALQAAIKSATVIFFLKHSIYLRIKEISTPLSGTVAG